MTIKGMKIFFPILLFLTAFIFVGFTLIYTDPTVGAQMTAHGRDTTFWIAFCFTLLQILLQIPLHLIAFKRAGDSPEAPSKFFACPFIYIGVLCLYVQWNVLFGMITEYHPAFGMHYKGGKNKFDSIWVKIAGTEQNAWIYGIGIIVAGLVLLIIAEIITRAIKRHFAERDRLEAIRVADMRAEAEAENNARKAMLAEQEMHRKQIMEQMHENAALETAERERQAELRAAQKAEERERQKNGEGNKEEHIDWSQYRRK